MNLKQILKSKQLKQTLQGLFVLGSFYFLGQSLAKNRSQIQAVMAALDWGIFLGAMVLLALSFTPRPLGMFFFLRGSSQNINFIQSSRAYFLSQLTKYLPGGIWVFPTRVVLLKESGVQASMSTLGLAYESIAMVISSAGVGLLALGMEPAGNMWNSPIMLGAAGVSVVGVVFVLFGPEIIKKLIPGQFSQVSFLNSMEKVPIKRRFANLSLTTGCYLLMWVLTGLSFYLLILALGGHNLPVFLPVGIFSLSWLVGFLSVFNPGGIGLREAAILLFLRTVVPEPIPILVALLSRVSWSLVEIFYFGYFSVFTRPVSPPLSGDFSMD